MIVIVMGVSGSGKTLIGQRLAARLGYAFVDADDHHLPGSVRKAAAGTPLTEADRRPWLDRLAALIDGWEAEGRDVVLACSALMRAHRRRLGLPRAGARLVFLDAERAVLAGRLAERTGHFFPAALLDSQLDALEAPQPEEHALRIDAAASPATVTADAVAALARVGAHAR